MNSMEFQNKIHMIRHLHSSQKKIAYEQSEFSIATLPVTEPKKGELVEVPTIDFLCECVEDCMKGLKVPINDFMRSDS